MIFPDIAPFHLERTLLSGQTFRWRKDGGGFRGVVGDTLVEIRQEADNLLARTFPKPLQHELIEDYFSLRYPMQTALQALSGDPVLKDALVRQEGIRLLRQEPWECLASFLMAINKGIPHIEKTIAALCETHGEKMHTPLGTFFTFPRPEALAQIPEQALRQTKMGFRARYLKAAAGKIVQEKIDLVAYRQKSYAETREFLMGFLGIGPKVADCICLFSLDHGEAFPVDVWMDRAMNRLFGGRRRLKLEKIHAIARQKYGAYAGLAQQYLYHDIRSTG